VELLEDEADLGGAEAGAGLIGEGVEILTGDGDAAGIGVQQAASARSKVVLPQPLRPWTATNSLAPTVRLRPSSTVRRPPGLR
jgi:hypothetical protein